MRELTNAGGENVTMTQNKDYIHRNNYNDMYAYLEPYFKYSQWKNYVVALLWYTVPVHVCKCIYKFC